MLYWSKKIIYIYIYIYKIDKKRYQFLHKWEGKEQRFHSLAQVKKKEKGKG